MKFDISVQICTFNRKEILIKCLESLFRQDYPLDRMEIVIIDDGSLDGSEEAVREIESPCSITYVYQENRGPAGARNAGIINSQGEYILFIDDDIIACRELVSEHMRLHREQDKLVVRGPVIHVDNFDNLDNRKHPYKLENINTNFFPTGNGSVAKRYLEEAGLFDEIFREYGWEDIELGFRLRRLGLKGRKNSRAITYHYKKRWKKSSLPGILKQARAKGRNAVLYYKKHSALRVTMATGIYPARMLMDKLFYFGGLGQKFCERIVENYNGEELTGLAFACARQLYTFEYFKTIRECL